MQTFIWIAIIPISLYALAVTNPRETRDAARSLVAGLKRRFRLYIANKYGEKAAAVFINELREEYSKQGYDMGQFEEAMLELRPDVVERLGTKVANDLMGEPTPLERYY